MNDHKTSLLLSMALLLATWSPDAHALQGGPDAFGYSFIDSNEPGGPTYSWVEIAGTGTATGLGDDSHLHLSMPFAVEFYGVTYTEWNIGSNGTFYTGPDIYLGLGNVCIPGSNSYGPERFVAGIWDDLNPATSGEVYYQTLGSAPNRSFVVQWDAVPRYGGSTYYTFEIIVYESNSDILVQYQSVSGGDYPNGSSATAGIQDSASLGLQYQCDTGLLQNSLAVLYTLGGCADADGDGHDDQACGGTDCDDGNAAVYPGAIEMCNGIDDDCNGLVDDNPINPTTYYQDADGDGYGSPLVWQDACSAPSGYVLNSGDCDDTQPWVYPGAAEICDGQLDNNCDGVDDPDETDDDGDGWNECAGDCDDSTAAVNPGMIEVCDGELDNDCNGIPDPQELDDDGDGWTECGGDCNDANAQIHPGMTEVCDGVLDNDCDGVNDPNEQDNDGDLYTECGGDCNDASAQIHPGMVEICDGILDNDCDGVDDPDETDDDGDGWNDCNGDCDDGNPAVSPGSPEVTCDGMDNDCNPATVDEPDADGDGYAACDDCDDGNAAVHPGAVEVPCDGLDNDCNPATVDGPDNDGDGSSVCGGDCDDNDPAVFPGATEVCNGIDDDCDGAVDVGAVDASTWYLDADGDGFGDDSTTAVACQAPPDHVAIPGDCSDSNPAVNPAALEVCNGIDDDCDPATNETADVDADGFTLCDGDCEDNDPAVFPGAEEICNGIDDDCDPATDEDVDGDGDGFTICDGDCDDGDAAVYPPATEVCDGIDNNCDGALLPDEIDDDGDGVMVCDGDCDDTDPLTFPGAPEQCDGLDNDCDGIVDEDVGLDQDGDGLNPCQGDCDDSDPSIYPGAPEACNGLDDDCDGVVPGDEIDGDLDGFAPCDGDCDDTDADLNLHDLDGDGWTSCDGDCDDGDDLVHPGVAELCNGLDDDCDGAPGADEMDADSDGFLACEDCDDGDPALHSGDFDEDGFSPCDGDCDDGDPATSPLADETCDDGVDNDCDGLVDLFDDDCGSGDDDSGDDDTADDDSGEADDDSGDPGDDDTSDSGDDDAGGAEFGVGACDCQSSLSTWRGAAPAALLATLLGLALLRRRPI